ncbi:MAG: hypothetical protein COY81_04745 [Candidatus Pacebacteria bacterium CG_4_10_14_0_8_um_filter_43_12]|nr:MAG: hypothetical protein COU66_01930 [Candidatus Pacebacteria bacterium CG10_big_fil_rev_8_21_14_0_10_44_11]PIY79041.1 MAG: hypothetical protein COY81_04745 [Candidatus Pacebacteria bacterium CG_4_10_14_0_8_um_filter_43_12]
MDQPIVCHTVPQLNSYLKLFSKLAAEHGVFFALDDQLHLLSQLSVTSNKQTEIVIDPRQLLTKLITKETKFLIVIHNHPSGKCFPSKADYQTTFKLIATGELIGFQLLDHLIVTNTSYFSFSESGLIEELKTGPFKDSSQIC